MKEFSPQYLLRSAYNSCANAVATQMVCNKHGVRKISGSKMNDEVNMLVRDGKAIPTREAYAAKLKELCVRHGVAFEGGIDSFLDGAWKMREQMGLIPEHQ